MSRKSDDDPETKRSWLDFLGKTLTAIASIVVAILI
jgi:hypothetical protein